MINNEIQIAESVDLTKAKVEDDQEMNSAVNGYSTRRIAEPSVE